MRKLNLFFFSICILLATNIYAGCGPERGGIIQNIFVGINLGQLGNRDFTWACDIHDSCYSNWRNTKEYCDREFLNNLQQECYNAYRGNRVSRSICAKVTAQAYYAAVMNFGQLEYDYAQGKINAAKYQLCVHEREIIAGSGLAVVALIAYKNGCVIL